MRNRIKQTGTYKYKEALKYKNGVYRVKDMWEVWCLSKQMRKIGEDEYIPYYFSRYIGTYLYKDYAGLEYERAVNKYGFDS